MHYFYFSADHHKMFRIENGDCYPNLELALRLAHYLSISTDELFQLDLNPIAKKGGP